jgi:hypothetical protein
MMIRPSFLSAALVCLGCSAGDAGSAWTGTVTDSAGVSIVSNSVTGVWEEGSGWTAEEDLRIGAVEGDPDYLFGHIAGICVGSDGRIFVADQGASRIAAYSEDGAFLDAFGESGSGPGELGYALGACLMGPGDTLHVYDMQNRRISRYATDGSVATSYRIDVQFGLPIVTDMRDDGRIVQQRRSFGFGGQPTVDSADAIVILDDDGGVADTLLAFPTGNTIRLTGEGQIIFFGTEPAWDLNGDGNLLYGTNDDYSIGWYDQAGALARVVRKPSQRQPFSESEQQLIGRTLEEKFREGGVPEPMLRQIMNMIEFTDAYPAYHRFLTGPRGSLWVQQVRTVNDMSDEERRALGWVIENPEVFVSDPRLPIGAPDWDVFDAEGRYLGVVTLPERFEVVRFLEDAIYGVWKDEMDVEYVMRLRVVGRV